MEHQDVANEQLGEEVVAVKARSDEPGVSEGESSLEENLFRSMFTNSPIGVYVVREGKFRFVNSRFQRDTGYPEEELLEMDSLSMVVPHEQDIVREQAVSMLKGERTAPYDFRIVDKGGEIRWIMGTVAPIQYGGRRAALGYYMDITDDKRVEEALRESEGRYKEMVANIGEAIATNVGVMERAWRMRDAISKLPTAQLVARTDVTEDLMVIRLRPQVDFTFKAGQYCTLGLGSVERAYSIVSAPHEPELEIFVELVRPPEGALTPLMWQLKVGDTMSIRPRSKGIFTMDERYHKHLMVATVTGIAPFMSTIRSYFHRGGQGHKFYVLQGASYDDEFTYDAEMEELVRDHPDTVVYVPTVSRPAEDKNAGWKGVTGRVNTIVDRYVEEFSLDAEDTLVYACGHPGMIEDLSERLTPRGFKVKEERYWKQ